MLIAIVTVVVLSFGLVVFVGPPYLPTLNPQVKAALDMLDLKKGQTMLELGCGDGRVLLAAAERGWRVVGIELNPLLVLVCMVRTWRYRKLVKVRWGNYWDTTLWGQADGIFGFVLPKYMTKLDNMIETWRGDRSVQLSSFAFSIPDKKVARESSGVFLYEYK
jgi:SAM-dependent methyltransferase